MEKNVLNISLPEENVNVEQDVKPRQTFEEFVEEFSAEYGPVNDPERLVWNGNKAVP